MSIRLSQHLLQQGHRLFRLLRSPQTARPIRPNAAESVTMRSNSIPSEPRQSNYYSMRFNSFQCSPSIIQCSLIVSSAVQSGSMRSNRFQCSPVRSNSIHSGLIQPNSVKPNMPPSEHHIPSGQFGPILVQFDQAQHGADKR